MKTFFVITKMTLSFINCPIDSILVLKKEEEKMN